MLVEDQGNGMSIYLPSYTHLPSFPRPSVRPQILQNCPTLVRRPRLTALRLNLRFGAQIFGPEAGDLPAVFFDAGRLCEELVR